MYIAVDIGGTHVRIAPFQSHRLKTVLELPTAECGPQDLLCAIKRISEGHHLEGVGIAIAGRVDAQRGELVAPSPNLPPPWQRHVRASAYARALQCPVRLCNDAVAATIGEAAYGKTRGDFVLLAWGTGIGGAAVAHKDRVTSVFAIEPGHMLIPSGKGTREWEELCGGAGLRRRFGKNPEKLTKREWRVVESEMAEGLTNIAALRPAKTLVLCGAIGLRQKQTVVAALRNINRKKTVTAGTIRRVQIAKLGDRSGLCGAYAIISDEAKTWI